MLTQYQQEKPGKDQKDSQQPQHEPPTLRLLCSITGGVMPAQWEDITGTTQLTFSGDEISFTTTVSARFWLMDCQTPRDAAKMAQEIYNEAIAIPFMARFAVFGRRSFPTEGQLRMFCMTDDKEEKTLEKQEGFQRIAVSRDVEVLEGKHQWLEFAGNLVPVTKRGDQLSIFFQPFQENRLAFNIKVRQQDDQEAASSGKVAIMKEPLNRADILPPQHPICMLSITLPDYTGPLPSLVLSEQKGGGGGGEDDQFKKQAPLTQRYSDALSTNVAETYPNIPIEFVSKTIGADWARLGRVLGIHPDDIRQIRREVPSGGGQEALHMLKIWVFLKGTSANESDLRQALRQIGRDDICVRMTDSDNHLMGAADSDINLSSAAIGTPVNLRQEFSSKGSLVTPIQQANNIIVPQQSAPIEVSAIAAAITPTAEVAAAPLFAAQPVTLTAPEQQIDVETVVTRTERHVHHSEDINEPVVDEHVTTQIFRDGQQMEQLEERKLGQPLNEQEQAQWEEMTGAQVEGEPENNEAMDYLQRSRKAMVVDGDEQHLMEYDEEGHPVGQTTVKTTTLITTEHLREPPPINIEEVEEEPQKEIESSPIEEESPSPIIVEEEDENKHSTGIQSQHSSEGSSVIIHDDKPQEADDPFKIYEEEIHFQEDNEPLTEVEKSSTFEEKDEEKEGGGGGTDLGISTYDNVHRETSNGFNEEDIQEEEEQQKRGANKIEPAKDASANLEDEKKEKEEEWARREHPEIQQFEQIQESFPIDDTTMITKKRTHIISTSQSRVKGLDEFASAAPSAGAAGYSPQASPAEQQYPIRDEESPLPPESLSISITSQPDSLMTTSSISVKDKIAQFELLKKVEESEDSVDGAKRRFGWHPQPKKTPDKEKSEERKSPRDEQRQPSPVGSDVPGANKSKIPRITSPTRLTPSPTVSPRKHEEKFQEIENNFLLEKFEEKGEANCLRKEYTKIEEYLFYEINEPLIEEEQHFIQKPQVFHSIVTDEPSHVEAFGEIERRKRDVEKTDLDLTHTSKDDGDDHFEDQTEKGESYKNEIYGKEIPEETEKLVKDEEIIEEKDRKEEYLIENEENEEERKLEELKQEKVEEEENFEFVQMPKEDEFVKMKSEKEEEIEEKKEENKEIIVMSEPLQKSEQIQSSVWLDKVPVESFINEKEVLEERKAILWPEEEQEKLKETETLIEEKAWWKPTKTEKEILISEEEKLNEENKPELLENQQKIFVEEKEKLIEDEKDEEETDEQSSTHTVIHRPEVLIEEAVDITPLMDRAFSLQGEEGCQTPTMSAARWKSLDERHSPSSLSSPVHSYPSPSPIIEITPPPIEDEEEWERRQMRDNEEERNIMIKEEEEENEFNENNRNKEENEQKKFMEEEYEKKVVEEEYEQKRLMKEQEKELQRLVEDDYERDKFKEEGDEKDQLIEEEQEDTNKKFVEKEKVEDEQKLIKEEKFIEEKGDVRKESIEENDKHENFNEEDDEKKEYGEDEDFGNEELMTEEYEKKPLTDENEDSRLKTFIEKDDVNEEYIEEEEQKIFIEEEDRKEVADEEVEDEKMRLVEEERKELSEEKQEHMKNESIHEEEEKNKFIEEKDKEKFTDEKEKKEYTTEEDVEERYTEEQKEDRKIFLEEEKKYIEEKDNEKKLVEEKEVEKEYIQEQEDKTLMEIKKEYIEEEHAGRKLNEEEEERKEHIEKQDERNILLEEENEYVIDLAEEKKFTEEVEKIRDFTEEEDEKKLLEEEKKDLSEERYEKDVIEKELEDDLKEYLKEEIKIQEDERIKFMQEEQEKNEFMKERDEERISLEKEKEYIEENNDDIKFKEQEEEMKDYTEKHKEKEETFLDEEKEYIEEEDEGRKLMKKDAEKDQHILEEYEDERKASLGEEKEYLKMDEEEKVMEGEPGKNEDIVEQEDRRQTSLDEEKEYLKKEEEKFTEGELENIEHIEEQKEDQKIFLEDEKEYIEDVERKKLPEEEEEKKEYIETQKEEDLTDEDRKEYIRVEEDEKKEPTGEKVDDDQKSYIEEGNAGRMPTEKEEERKEYMEKQEEEIKKFSDEGEKEYIEEREELTDEKIDDDQKKYIGEEDTGRKFMEEEEERKEYIEKEEEKNFLGEGRKEYIKEREELIDEKVDVQKEYNEEEGEKECVEEEGPQKKLTDNVDEKREFIVEEHENESRKFVEEEKLDDEYKKYMSEKHDMSNLTEEKVDDGREKFIEVDEQSKLLEEKEDEVQRSMGEEDDHRRFMKVHEEKKEYIGEDEERQLMDEERDQEERHQEERGLKEFVDEEKREEERKEFTEKGEEMTKLTEEFDEQKKFPQDVAEQMNFTDKRNEELMKEKEEEFHGLEDDTQKNLNEEGGESKVFIEEGIDEKKVDKFIKGDDRKLITEEQEDEKKFMEEKDTKEELILVKDEPKEFVDEDEKDKFMDEDEQNKFIKEDYAQNKLIKEQEDEPKRLSVDKEEKNEFMEEDERKEIMKTDELEKEHLFEKEVAKQAGELVDNAIKRALEDSMILQRDTYLEEAKKVPGHREEEEMKKFTEEVDEQIKFTDERNEELVKEQDELQRLEEEDKQKNFIEEGTKLADKKLEDEDIKDEQILVNISESRKSSESEEEDEEISLLTTEEKEENEGEANNSPELVYGDGDEELSGENSQQSPSELYKAGEGEEGRRDHHHSLLPSSSLLLPSGIPRRPKSPLPPPIAATPPQTGKVENIEKDEEKREEVEEEVEIEEIKREEEEEESMLLSDVKMPVDNLLVFSTHKDGDEDEVNYFGPTISEERDTLGPDLMIVQSKSLEEVKSHGKDIIDDPWLSSFIKEQKEREDWGQKKEVQIEETEEGEEPLEEPQHQIGGSLDTSPSEKRRRRSSAASVHGSTNGSLSEFERIEQEIIEGGGSAKNLNSSPQHSPEAGEGKRRKSAGKQQHQSPTREGGVSAVHRGSADSLNEFEQLEREIHEAVASEDIMMLSDIREDEEGEEVEGYELSGEEIEEEEEEENDRRDYLGKELKKENNNNEVMMISSGYDSSGQTQQIELIAQQQSPESEKILQISSIEKSTENLKETPPPPKQTPDEKEEKQEEEEDKLITNISPKPKIISEQQKPEFKGKTENLFKQQKEIIKKQNIPSTSEKKEDFVFGGGGGGEIIVPSGGSLDKEEEEEDDDNSEKTIFETVSVNSADGSEEKIVRTAITRVRDPIYSRVRFAGTEDEQQIKAILESGRTDEFELRDPEGNITRLRTVVERGSTSSST
ncbi:unnamed protein product [Meloidogyne enterolobii]|uniref:Uncharacterized protein n=1 Tax=Meloidogyne enterolobii TaxID=390850 RepID=A0ACB0YX50_MELEN